MALLSKKIAAILTGSAFMLSCGNIQDQKTDLKHNAGDPVSENSAWSWSKISEQQFKTNVLAQQGLNITLPSDHELTKRAQYWVDRIDSELRRQNPAALAKVPKPTAIVANVDQFNAFVSSGLVCYPIATTGSARGDQADILFVLPQDGDLAGFQSAEIPRCMEVQRLNSLQQVADDFNSKNINGCQLSVVNRGLKLNGTGCLDGRTGLPISGASKLALVQTHPFITIFKQLFDNATENQFVGIVAHELGHYYKSHSTASEGTYNYFYKMEDRNPGHKPDANPDLEQIGQLAIAASQASIGLQSLQPATFQKVSPYLYNGLGDVAQKVCKAGNCPVSCKKVVSLQNDATYKSAQRYYPFSPLADSTIYQSRYESNILACMSQVQVQSIGIDSIISSVRAPKWSVATYPANASAFLNRVWNSSADKLTQVVQQLPTTGSMSDWTKAASVALTSLDTEVIDVLRTVYQERIVQYTPEQEADDLSVEWAHLVGIGPMAGVETMLLLADLQGDSHEVFGFSFSKSCKQLFDSNWLDDNGDPVYIPVGDFTDDHHSSCFRAYNAVREIEAHNYSTVSNFVSLEIPWSELQTLTRSIVTPGLIDGQAFQLETSLPQLGFTDKVMHSCPLAKGIEFK